MAQVLYGFWKDTLIDNRGKPKEEWTESPFKIDEDFNGKPLKVLVNWDGFLVFDESVDVLSALAQYMFEISSYGCCGRCFPGRVGTRLLSEQLTRLREKTSEADINTCIDMAESINNSAKCTVAPTACIPVIHFLKNFRDVVRGLSASGRLSYVKHLTAPCTAGCPANVKIPEFIEEVKDRRFLGALATIRETMPLAGVCGRVCPHPCEDNCRRGLVDGDDPVSIMVLKRTPWDYEYYHHKKPEIPVYREKTGKKVIIVGAGPAGLTAAYYLAQQGHDVEILEMMEKPGGMVTYGIPDYREPWELLKAEVDVVENMGVKITYGVKLGRDVSLQELKEKYDSVLVAIGAWKSRDMGVEGEKDGFRGVSAGGIVFLEQVVRGVDTGMGKKVVVVGGGNTAIDCVRVALREGATDVNLVYRRSRTEMPAEDIEIIDAEEEGVKYHFLCNPVRVIAKDNQVTGVECIRMELGEPDESGRRRPRPVEGSEFVIECDTVIPAIGQYPDLSFLSEADGIDVTKWDTIKVTDDLYTSTAEGIFSAGDCEWGPMTVVKAIGAARWAAVMMDRYMMEGKVYLTDNEKLELSLYKNKVFDKSEKVCEPATIERVHQAKLSPEVRVDNYEEVEKPYTEDQAYREATRCLRCMRMAMVGIG